MKLPGALVLAFVAFTLHAAAPTPASALTGTLGDFSAKVVTKPYEISGDRALMVRTITLTGPGLAQGRPQLKCGRKGCLRPRGKKHIRSRLYKPTVKFRRVNVVVRRGGSITVLLVPNDKNLAGRVITLSLKRKGKLRLRQSGYGCITGGGKRIECPKPAGPTRETHPPLILFGDESCESTSPAPWVGVPGGSASITALHTPGVAAAGTGFCDVQPLAGDNSVARDIAGKFKIGQVFRFSIWLRSSDQNPFCGDIVLWGVGPSSNQNDGHKQFCVGPQWTNVTTEFRPQELHTKLRAQIYFGARANNLYFDGQAVTTELDNSSFESGAAAPWSDFANPGVSTAVFSVPGLATDGTHLLVAKSGSPGHSFAQDVAALPQPGQSYTASIWLRSPNGTPISGRLALFGLRDAGEQEAGTTNFAVNGDWQEISVKLTPTVPAHSLRFEVYIDTANAEIQADDAQLYLN